MTSLVNTDTGESSRGAHRLALLGCCPFAFGLAYLLGYEPAVESRYTARGTCVHLALAANYSGQDWRVALMNAPERVAFAAGETFPLIEGYLRTWAEADRAVQVLSLETEYQLPLCGDPHEVLTRRLDRVVRIGNELRVYDPKTASRPSERLARADLDPTLFTQEMVGRWVLAPQLGLKWGGVYLDLIPTGTKGAYQRVQLRFASAMLRKAEESLLFWSKQERQLVDEFRRGVLDPWKLEQSWQCHPNGYTCDFSPICLHGRSALARFVKKAGY